MEKETILERLRQEFPAGVKEVSTPLGDEVAVIGKEALLEMVYHFFSLSRKRRLRIKTGLDESDLRIASLTSLWKNANWLEREVYDLFGVHFEGHPDLRRIFMYDGFEGHPLRKDYPLRRRQPLIPLKE
jgi:NADH-quinone oxidoreductase subunit C